MKKAVVTGHSKGIGAGIASALLAEGYQVLGLSRSLLPGLPQGLLPGPGAGAGAGLEQVAMDLGDTDALAEWIAGGALAGFLGDAGRALLVNNAGIVTPVAPPGRQGAAAIARAVTVNISAALVLADAFVAATAGSAGAGNAVPDRRLVHISSGAGRGACQGWSVYCATKAALDHHARVVAEDGLPGLKVESLAPGIVDTGMQAVIRGTPEEDFALRGRFVELKETGALSDPESVGAEIVAHVTGPDFGMESVTDIRDFRGFGP